MNIKKKQAGLISIASNSLLVLLKFTAGYITGSVSVMAEALHSLADMLASVMVAFSVTKADKPADREHPFGHGKIENISALIESILIILAAVLIMHEAVDKALEGAVIKMPLAALSVMAAAAAINYFVSSFLFKAARDSGSIALEADARHIRVDIYSSVGVFTGLLLLVVTGYHVIDTIIAIVVSLVIFYEGTVMARRSIGDLIDSALPDEELKIIREALDARSDLIKNYYDLRTRKSGNTRIVNMRITVCPNQRTMDTHNTMNIIEKDLSWRLSDCSVTIHPEPCEHYSSDGSHPCVKPGTESQCEDRLCTNVNRAEVLENIRNTGCNDRR
jgi:cation diffusion facilitator family transporter